MGELIEILLDKGLSVINGLEIREENTEIVRR